MKFDGFINFFIHPSYFENIIGLKKSQLFVRACFLTALFSAIYVYLSIVFSFEKGVYLMIYNIIGFSFLPFLTKTRIPVSWLGNAFVFTGSSAVIILTYYSGGVWSAIYPWIIAIPVLALLVVNRTSGVFWGIVAFLFMLWFAYLALNGIALPTEYNTALHTAWYVTILPGLLLIILFISFVFEHNQSRALNDLHAKNEQLEAQQRTIAAQSTKLEALLEEKNDIINILAHDLRNPLKNICSLVQFVNTEKDPVKKSECMDLIVQSSENAQDLVNKVLEMDALEHDTRKLQFEKMDVAEVMSEAIEKLQDAASKKRIRLQMVNNSNSGIIYTDKTYLLLIFENLLSNALKFSLNNTTVEARIDDVKSNIQIKIIDEGPGITPEEEDKLFMKFSRLSTRPTGGESSTGLGLALVKKYASLINGNVWYEGNEGKGATFVLALPAKN